MAKPEWGVKRFCGGCGARFYDMRRDPIICPKCGVTHDPVAQARPQRPKPTPPAAAKPKPKPAKVEDTGGDDLLIADADADESDENDEEEEAIEDASELGEDKDDILEVIDNAEGDKEPET
ncbi:MAG: TIGR02300 family protein [Alphaproteobacteria bacterium]